MKKCENDTAKLNGEVNRIKCYNCGASISVIKGECEYCHTKVKYLQEWILE